MKTYLFRVLSFFGTIIQISGQPAPWNSTSKPASCLTLHTVHATAFMPCWQCVVYQGDRGLEGTGVLARWQIRRLDKGEDGCELWWCLARKWVRKWRRKTGQENQRQRTNYDIKGGQLDIPPVSRFFFCSTPLVGQLAGCRLLWWPNVHQTSTASCWPKQGTLKCSTFQNHPIIWNIIYY